MSISYSHTLGTRVRLSLMRSVSKRQKAHDPDAVCSVTSFTARPLLRVGGKDKGTRFLSFVDAMLGFRHLLTDEDLNKASSLCTSMKGTLKSKFIVLSDDKMLPPPPSTRRKRVLSGDQEQSLPAKNSRPEKNSARVSRTNPSPGTSAQSQADVALGDRPFQVVDRSRKKSLPAGVTPIPKRATPRRAVKDKAGSHQVATQDERMSEASGSASEEEGAGSDGTVVEVEVTESDWVIISSVCSSSLIISLLTPFSTILSLLITDLIRLN